MDQIFLIHHSLSLFPLCLNQVAGIVGRADLLCALFFQLSFLTYCKAFNRGRCPTQALLFVCTVIFYNTHWVYWSWDLFDLTSSFQHLAVHNQSGLGFLFSGSDRNGRFSVQWVVVSILLCAAAMLCKEQGITVLV